MRRRPVRISHECLCQWIYASRSGRWTCASTWRAAETPDEEKGRKGAHPDAIVRPGRSDPGFNDTRRAVDA